MQTDAVIPTQQQKTRPNRNWLRVLFIGLGLFVLTTIVLFWTDNTNMYPTVILIGNFLVPIVFVAFLYDHRHLSSLTPMTLVVSFIIGGVLGVIGAGILEFLLLPVPSDPNLGLPFTSAMLIGLIEEGCKILAVIIVARHLPHTSEMDGLVLGGAVGMGFAALESTGYAFTIFLASGGHVGISIVETIMRGLLAPFGHGIWTGILASVLFSESGPRHFRITIPVILTYLFVSALHGFWDGTPHSVYFVLPPGIPISLTNIVLSILGLFFFVLLYRRSLTGQKQVLHQQTV